MVPMPSPNEGSNRADGDREWECPLCGCEEKPNWSPLSGRWAECGECGIKRHRETFEK